MAVGEVGKMNDCPIREGLRYFPELYCPLKRDWDCPDLCPFAPALRAVVENPEMVLVARRKSCRICGHRCTQIHELVAPYAREYTCNLDDDTPRTLHPDGYYCDLWTPITNRGGEDEV